MLIITETKKLFMYKIVLSDHRGYRGNRGPTHFAKTRLSVHYVAYKLYGDMI